MDTTRVFIAIELPPSSAGPLQRVIARLKQSIAPVRWIRPEQMHITLKFLGEMDNRLLPQVCERMRAACHDIPPFHVTLAGLGAFPQRKAPRVLWVGVEEGADSMRQLSEQLEQQLMELGIPRESRAFHPHLTLGRVGRGVDPELFGRQVAEHSTALNSQFDVNEVLLIASLREKGGMIYERIDSAELIDDADSPSS